MAISKNTKISIVSPARICLFGDHQDYLGLPVIACAINWALSLEAKANKKQSFEIRLPDMNEVRTLSIYGPYVDLQKRDYFISGLRVASRYGCIPNKGYTITIKGNIPLNAGVSSSSALVVSWIHFLLTAFGCDRQFAPKFLAQLAYEAEVLEHGEPGGKMDQFTISLGNVVYLEIGSHYKIQTIGDSLDGLILADSGVKKETLSILASTKDNTLEAIRLIKKEMPNFDLEKITPAEVAAYSIFLSETLQPYFYAAVQNHAITQLALAELSMRPMNYKRIGTLMNEHHAILKNLLKVTVPKIDTMINIALENGAYGAKIVGSGGGGCIVVLAPQEKISKICDELIKMGALSAYPVSVATGSASN